MSSLLPPASQAQPGTGLWLRFSTFSQFVEICDFAILPLPWFFTISWFQTERQTENVPIARILPLFQVSRSLSLSLYTYDWYYLLNKDDDDDTSYFDVFTLRKGGMKKRMIPFDSPTSKTLWSINPSHNLKLAALLDRLTWKITLS